MMGTRTRPDVVEKKRRQQLKNIPSLLQEKGYRCLTNLEVEYRDQTTILTLQHVACPDKTIYTTKWRNFKRGNGRCPTCVIRSKKHNIEYIENELNKKGFDLITREYKNNMSKITILCHSGQHLFETCWSTFQQNPRCGQCARGNRDVYWAQLPENRNRLKEWCDQNPNRVFTSRPERELLEWIQQYYPGAKKYRDGTYEIDVFIPKISVGIEYNGLYHHQEDVLDKRYGKGVGKKYHLDKTKHFKSKGIRLIHIFAHEWRDRQEQVKSFLLSAIGKNLHKVGARQCNVIWTDNKSLIKQAYQFLDKYHIQGARYGTRYATLAYYKEKIIAVATFGRHHRNNKNWVLTRFCTKSGYTVQGLLSKVTIMAFKQLQTDIISWVHYRLSDGNGYRKAGWTQDAILPPDYFYHRHEKVISKQARQKKKVNTPRGITEKQHAKMEGLEPVYDCGKLRFKYNGQGLMRSRR